MMKCEVASEMIIDQLTGNLTDSTSQGELHAHLDGCESCRQDATRLRSTWADLGNLTVPDPSQDGLTQLTASLSGAKSDTVRSQTLTRTGIAASVVLALLIGFATGQRSLTRLGSMADGSEYLFLLREEAQPLEDLISTDVTQIVAEYRAWANQLSEKRQLIDAQKLEDEPELWIAGLSGARVTARVDTWPRISGFYLVRASNLEAAILLARDSPHLRYGGAIEVHTIDQLPGDN